MRIFKAGFLLVFAVLFNVNIVNAMDTSIYPQAKEGYKQVIINLPELKKENDVKVELLVGKMMNVDCNRTWLLANLEEKTLEGYGYDYFVLNEPINIASTRMWCATGKRENKFITLSNVELIRYNSKLPIILYVPKDIDVKYKLWKTDNQEFEN